MSRNEQNTIEALGDEIDTKKNSEEKDEEKKYQKDGQIDLSVEIENNEDECNLTENEGVDDDYSSGSSSETDHDDVANPLLKYGRLAGDLPRSDTTIASPLSTCCKCSTLGRVVLQPNKTQDPLNQASLPLTSQSSSIAILQSKAQICNVLASAFEDGSIHLTDATTGNHICSPSLLKVKNGNGHADIVCLSFDSGANYLGALTSDGYVAIFELKYGLKMISQERSQYQHNVASTTSGSEVDEGVQTQGWQNKPEKKLFDSFLSRLAGDHQAAKADEESEHNYSQNVQMLESESLRHDPISSNDDVANSECETVLCLSQPISVARFNYSTVSESRGIIKATCLAIDPSYNRKREKAIVVGFNNGLLKYTKRSAHGGITTDDRGFGGVMGSLLQPKRTDVDLYQGTGSITGIQTITWRANLMSWADESGIKIFDIQKMNRVAHIDRPSGARVSLYPHISDLKPTLRFERSDSLLICWGDCLMCMSIETVLENVGSGNVKRTKVKCKMAWELDCVGCDVQPVDKDHVAVLGLTSAAILQEEGNNDVNDEEIELLEKFFVELQIIKRSDGSVTANDILPLVVSNVDSDRKPRSNDFELHSSFCTSRMEDYIEAESEEFLEEQGADLDIQNVIMNTMASSINETRPAKKLTDFHLKWNMDSYKKIILDKQYENQNGEDQSISSDISEDSDDYSFLLDGREYQTSSTKVLSNVPVMVISSKSDIVLAQVRDADDSIEHAQKNENHGLALRHGLGHRKMLRRFSLDELIDNYLTAVLNPRSRSIEGYECPRSLSLRRLKIAAQSTPILFGGNMKLWERWVHEFSLIPGGLLILKDFIPVRDPKLPPQIYEKVLRSMFTEIIDMLLRPDPSGVSTIHKNAVELYIEALRAWGNSSSLRDRMQLHRYAMLHIDHSLDESPSNDQVRLYDEAERSLKNRMQQSAAIYLQSNNDLEAIDTSVENSNYSLPPSGKTSDELFSIGRMRSYFEDTLKSLESPKGRNEVDTNEAKLATFEALAELEFMDGKYKKCLYYYLEIGAIHSLSLLECIEDDALNFAFRKSKKSLEKKHRYKHLLKLVTSNELQSSLLELKIKTKGIPALLCFISLLGLEAVREFLVDYTVLPDNKKYSVQTTAYSLQVDAVSMAFKEYPKLQLWFLQSILIYKPEIYVHFPNTAVPPNVIKNLHKTHFDLLVEFEDRENSFRKKKLSVIPTFDEVQKKSPLLKFLKVNSFNVFILLSNKSSSYNFYL